MRRAGFLAPIHYSSAFSALLVSIIGDNELFGSNSSASGLSTRGAALLVFMLFISIWLNFDGWLNICITVNGEHAQCAIFFFRAKHPCASFPRHFDCHIFSYYDVFLPFTCALTIVVVNTSCGFSC